MQTRGTLTGLRGDQLLNAPNLSSASKNFFFLLPRDVSNISQYSESYFEHFGDAFFNISHLRALYAKHCCQSPHRVHH